MHDGLYDDNGKLYRKPCGKKMDETREDSLTKHITPGFHGVACAKHIRAGAKFVLAPGYEQREETRQSKEKEAKERTDKKRKPLLCCAYSQVLEPCYLASFLIFISGECTACPP